MQFTRNIIPGGLQDQRVIHSFGIPLILALLIGLLYRSVLDQWWMFDDTQILKHAVAFAPVDYFFSPTAWRSYVIFSLTPWLTLVYDLDLSLFGFSPKGFYAHNLLTLLACAILLYELLRPLTDRLFAGLGASLFLLGTPTAVAVEQLMVRHYLEGLLLFFLGFSCYLRSIRRQSWLWSLLSGLFFALAFSAKEIYVPMALAPLFLPLFHWRQRVLFAAPMLIALLLYVPWRKAMLGSFMGGYLPSGGMAATPDLGALFYRFSKVPDLLWDHAYGTAGLAVLVVGIGLIRSKKPLRTLLFGMALAGLSIMPLLPLGLLGEFSQDTDRFFLLPWLLIVVALSFGAYRLGGEAPMARFIGAFCMLMVALASLSKSQSVMAEREGLYRLYAREGQAFLNLREGDQLLATPSLLAHFFMGLKDLGGEMIHQAPQGHFTMDEASLDGSHPGEGKIYRFDPLSQKVVNVTDKLPQMMDEWRQSLRDTPLTVDVYYEPLRQSLEWSMGPYREGSFHLLSGGSLIPISRQGSLRRESPLPSCFRIRYQDVKGWRVYSPPLQLTSLDAERLKLHWTGVGDLFNTPSSSKTCDEPS